MVQTHEIDWLLLNKSLFDLPEHQWESYERQVNLYMEWVAQQIDRTALDFEIKQKARNHVKQKQYEELYRLQALQQTTPVIKQIQDVRNSLGVKGETIDKPYIWLCVNPNSTYTFREFQMLVSKMVTKVWVSEYVYVYEQRGITEEEMGKGFHLHAIIKKPENKKPSHCVRELASTFKKCCDVSNYHFFQVKFIDIPEKDRKLEYILGTKDSNDENQKDLKQNIDKIWRAHSNIQPYFFSNIELGKYATQEK